MASKNHSTGKQPVRPTDMPGGFRAGTDDQGGPASTGSGDPYDDTMEEELQELRKEQRAREAEMEEVENFYERPVIPRPGPMPAVIVTGTSWD